MQNNTNKKLKIIIIIIILLVLSLTVFISQKILEHIKDPIMFRKWIDSYGNFAPLVYCLTTIFQILIPFIPGEPFELVSGYAFGTLKGTILCILSESIASIIIILLVKKIGIKIVELFFSKEKIESLKFLKTSKIKEIIFSILFVMPGTPKDLLCYFVGLTDINIYKAMIITSVGRLPSIITSTITGSLINEQSYKVAIITVFITLILSLLGIYIYRKTKNNQ